MLEGVTGMVSVNLGRLEDDVTRVTSVVQQSVGRVHDRRPMADRRTGGATRAREKGWIGPERAGVVPVALPSGWPLPLQVLGGQLERSHR